MLVLKRRPKQCIWIDKKVYIEIVNVRGREVEIHIDFPRGYEVLRGELVDLEPPKLKPEGDNASLSKVLKAILIFTFAFLPSASAGDGKMIKLPARSLLCETPLDYYGAFEDISDGTVSVEGSFPSTRHNCIWTDRVYEADVIMVAPPFFLAEVILRNPSEGLAISRGWVGLSEVHDAPAK